MELQTLAQKSNVSALIPVVPLFIG